ncbi:MAG TPA: hypothetical protein VHG70_16615 [Nocardioidaceae bacterium]|nr:hypothetical protein [Nocardioidaceae bacterium]
MTAAALVLTVFAGGLAGGGWWARAGTRAHLGLCAAMVGVLAVLAALVLVAGPDGEWSVGAARTLLVLLGLLAVAGGGPLAVAVLSVADHQSATESAPSRPAESLDDGQVLRGGAWIGSLERVGIFATLAAGWPEGVAVVLAVKGVGRYQELGESGASERFIIGTSASVLWACACAGVWWFG